MMNKYLLISFFILFFSAHNIVAVRNLEEADLPNRDLRSEREFKRCAGHVSGSHSPPSCSGSYDPNDHGP